MNFTAASTGIAEKISFQKEREKLFGKYPEVKMHKKSIITPIDEDYISTLSDEDVKYALDDLRETDAVRKHAIEAIREWAINNPRIISLRLDSNFLLRFLRCRKFSIPMTKEMLERYLVLRHYVEEGEKIFTNLDCKLPAIQELLDLGYIFALPQRDRLGRRVILYRLQAFNPSKHKNFDMVKVHGIVYETLLEDETNQIRGIVHIIDSTNMGLNYLTIFTPHQAYRIGKNLEKILPMRHKEIHGLRVHPSIKFAVDFALSQMSAKMKKRVFLHKNIEDATIEHKILPLEYGGSQPMREMIDLFKQELEVKRDLLVLHDDMKVHLEKYPKCIVDGSVRSLKKTIDSFDATTDQTSELYGVTGSFRKLEID